MSEGNPKQSKMYVKFFKGIACMESFLKKHDIEYRKENLKETPFGKAYMVSLGHDDEGGEFPVDEDDE